MKYIFLQKFPTMINSFGYCMTDSGLYHRCRAPLSLVLQWIKKRRDSSWRMARVAKRRKLCHVFWKQSHITPPAGKPRIIKVWDMSEFSLYTRLPLCGCVFVVVVRVCVCVCVCVCRAYVCVLVWVWLCVCLSANVGKLGWKRETERGKNEMSAVALCQNSW